MLNQGEGSKALHTGWHVKEFSSFASPIDLTAVSTGAPYAGQGARWLYVLAAASGATITLTTGAGDTTLSAKYYADLGIPIIADLRAVKSVSGVTLVSVFW